MDDQLQRNLEQPTNTAVQVERVSRSEIVVHVVGGLRDEVTAQLRSSVVSGLTGSPEALVLDLSVVTDIDADGVDVLETAAVIAGERDICFCLVLPPDSPVLTALAEAKLSALFEIFSSVTEALRKTAI
ncbi:MAG TPA: STAS domain-containing protein [Mycobacterium sp.]|nr:STAS domain-containing protein [Mycobacterium sp.]